MMLAVSNINCDVTDVVDVRRWLTMCVTRMPI